VVLIGERKAFLHLRAILVVEETVTDSIPLLCCPLFPPEITLAASIASSPLLIVLLSPNHGAL